MDMRRGRKKKNVKVMEIFMREGTETVVGRLEQ